MKLVLSQQLFSSAYRFLLFNLLSRSHEVVLFQRVLVLQLFVIFVPLLDELILSREQIKPARGATS